MTHSRSYVYIPLKSNDARVFPTQCGKGDGSGNANTGAPSTPFDPTTGTKSYMQCLPIQYQKQLHRSAGVALHDCIKTKGWRRKTDTGNEYDVFLLECVGWEDFPCSGAAMTPGQMTQNCKVRESEEGNRTGGLAAEAGKAGEDEEVEAE
ncbi:hypothetical protein BGX38DRAFT_1272679 [Terfezia claveryi]|nr:hypothetical protein BGX38DRAFT_1272679 [Terfezia claveryi]